MKSRLERKEKMKLENTYAKLPETLYTLQKPIPVIKSELILWNEELAKQLDLSFQNTSPKELANLFSGNQLLEGSLPLAQAYAGHQFAHFTMLGDGRALILGEILTSNHERFDLQLKGSGVTPYSRGGDGRATLHAMLREYIMSEAMHHLGISTSRSLAVVSTGEPVYRQTQEKGAILTRIMKSHLRIGTFQYASHYQSKATLEALTAYTLQRLYPASAHSPNPSLSLLEEVMKQQIILIVDWLRVGFIHGVMNTDNTSISGESFDYGPCAFMNYYHPDTAFSAIDKQHRYAFAKQASILQWNLYRFAEALLPLIHENEAQAIDLAYATLEPFPAIFHAKYFVMMKNKLGIMDQNESDVDLIERLLLWMEKKQADYTNTFIELMRPGLIPSSDFQDPEFLSWREDWLFRIRAQKELPRENQQVMEQHNPRIIPRSHQVEEALSKAVGQNDFTLFHHLLDSLKQNYTLDTYSPLMDPPSRDFDLHYKTHCNT